VNVRKLYESTMLTLSYVLVTMNRWENHRE